MVDRTRSARLGQYLHVAESSIMWIQMRMFLSPRLCYLMLSLFTCSTANRAHSSISENLLVNLPRLLHVPIESFLHPCYKGDEEDLSVSLLITS